MEYMCVDTRDWFRQISRESEAGGGSVYDDMLSHVIASNEPIYSISIADNRNNLTHFETQKLKLILIFIIMREYIE